MPYTPSSNWIQHYASGKPSRHTFNTHWPIEIPEYSLIETFTYTPLTYVVRASGLRTQRAFVSCSI